MQKTEIRMIRPEEYPVLDDFLWLAVFVPPGSPSVPRSILDKPELQVYVENFGREGDLGLVAESDGRIVGACWARIMNDYGHVDNETPSLAISVLEPWRSVGIGTSLLRTLFSELGRRGCRRVSLSVQKMNRAADLYRRLGFRVLREDDEEYVMIRDLRTPAIPV